MEPWQAEALYRRKLERMPGLDCVCCGEKIQTEQYLDLEAFGLQGCACEGCVNANTHWTEQSTVHSAQLRVDS